jgi:hypothetical protein
MAADSVCFTKRCLAHNGFQLSLTFCFRVSLTDGTKVAFLNLTECGSFLQHRDTVSLFLRYLTLSLLTSYIYGAPSKARNLTYIYIYMDENFYWGFCFLNRAFR